MSNELFEKARAEELGRYYCKGFGNSLDGINTFAEAYLHLRDPEVQQRQVGFAHKEFSRTDGFYDKIPFDTLQGEVFAPLFVVRRMLPVYRGIFNQIVATRSEPQFKRLTDYSVAIVEVGRLYESSFAEALVLARSFPEGKDFVVNVTALDGVVWPISHLHTIKNQ